MGHSAAVNQGTYQKSLPVTRVTKVGYYLLASDNGDKSRFYVSVPLCFIKVFFSIKHDSQSFINQKETCSCPNSLQE